MDLVLKMNYAEDGFDVIRQARSGIERQKADDISTNIKLTNKELALILNLSERALRHLRPASLLNNNSSERLLRLEQLILHGLDVFDERPSVLAKWLRIPLAELNQETPLAMLDTMTGFGVVDAVLGRIEHNICA